MPVERVQTLIIGGGQAGLVMSHRLKQRGLAHLVLERRRIAERWRSERWDGLKFQFPNWSVRLPDFSYPHSDPDGFSTNSEILDFITAYAAFVAPPIRCGVEVKRLRRRDGGSGFVAETSEGPIEAAKVVVATGPYQRAVMPAVLRDHADLFQEHASRYRKPGQLPSGAVLVVGSGASGAQIAEELWRAGRRVHLSVGRHTRLPRRYRGRDLIWWLSAMGIDQTTVEARGPSRLLPVITGACGGHTIDFRRFAADGVTLLGRVEAAREGILDVAADLAQTSTFLDLVDAHVERHGLNMPQDPAARDLLSDPPCLVAPIRRLDLRAEGIGAVIWATGYGVDFGWIEIPVLDARGEPGHRGGITAVPGLYFLACNGSPG
jgi:putative flavoprotein involved in K+ transport